MYIKNQNMIITASRGRKIKVNKEIFSFGKYHQPGETRSQ